MYATLNGIHGRLEPGMGFWIGLETHQGRDSCESRP